jgi:hypothetical protein
MDDYSLENSLFPTKPMCLMDTPEFSEEKKKRTHPIFRGNGSAPPFCHRHIFIENNDYFDPSSQRRYEISLEK